MRDNSRVMGVEERMQRIKERGEDGLKGENMGRKGVRMKKAVVKKNLGEGKQERDIRRREAKDNTGTKGRRLRISMRKMGSKKKGEEERKDKRMRVRRDWKSKPFRARG